MAELSRLPGPITELWDWQMHALCAGLGTEEFFHPDGERGPNRAARERAAKAVCARCPVMKQCAAHALAVREPYGVWGGLSEDDRDAILGRGRAARAS
ncbi:MAG: WhiB family transcriptional regulator [Frankiaceae bacterium]